MLSEKIVKNQKGREKLPTSMEEGRKFKEKVLSKKVSPNYPRHVGKSRITLLNSLRGVKTLKAEFRPFTGIIFLFLEKIRSF